MSASISIGDSIPWSSLEDAAREAGETWSGELPPPPPVPVIETDLGHGREGDGRAPTAGVPTALRAMANELRRYIARALLDVTRYRFQARWCTARADEETDPRRVAWWREQAATWRRMGDALRAEVRKAEGDLAACLRFTGAAS